VQASALNSADMNEHICAAIIRLNKAEAFLGIEPFNSSGSHTRNILKRCCKTDNKRTSYAVLSIDVLDERSYAAQENAKAAKSFDRNSMRRIIRISQGNRKENLQPAQLDPKIEYEVMLFDHKQQGPRDKRGPNSHSVKPEYRV
jgi:hypothetical protein